MREVDVGEEGGRGRVAGGEDADLPGIQGGLVITEWIRAKVGPPRSPSHTALIHIHQQGNLSTLLFFTHMYKDID